MVYNKILKNVIQAVLVFSIVVFIGSTSYANNNFDSFDDVPLEHWAYEYVHKLRSLNITNGIGENNFGLGKQVTRAEFAAFLCKLMGWEVISTGNTPFSDIPDIEAWYYPFVETALLNGAISQNPREFRPDEPITREEIAIMLIRALGYNELAKQVSYLESPFTDVTEQTGYITIAKDLGIISGIGGGLFKPYDTATREQAATMMIRSYELLNNKIDFINAFYAISSASQMGSIPNFDSISFGWGRLELGENGVSINTTRDNNNEYRVPLGYSAPYQIAADGKIKMLMVAVSDANALEIISDETLSQDAAALMAEAITLGISGTDGEVIGFDGVVVDFEGLKGEASAQNFNRFLTTLRNELDKYSKLMYVAVHPQRRPELEYYDGYDYKTIGGLADKVILMAHDYDAKRLTAQEMETGFFITPLAPIDEVYYALARITDENTGVSDKNKIVLQISFNTSQWKLADGKIINERPYSPSYSTLANRILSDAIINYSNHYESPYVTFFNDSDKSHNVIWYEDERSVEAKIKLAELFGIKGISLWRLGSIPDFENDIYLNVLSMINSLK